MEEVQEALQLQIMDQEAKEGNPNSSENPNVNNISIILRNRSYKWWILMAIYTFLVLSGQSVATLLGRLYYANGGSSIWMATFVQTAGFVVLLPFYFMYLLKNAKTTSSTSDNTDLPSPLVVAMVYVSLGVILAGICVLYSLGLLYLPVSTYSLICASQLAFNAFFSYFLNAQKFTPLIINSLVLLTISSTLLVFQNESNTSNTVSRGKYILGFICTFCASAGYGLMLSLTQLAFRKVFKKETVKAIFEMIVYQSIVATCLIVVGLFASGDWKILNREMDEFKLGKVSYLMTLVWIAISWQVYFIGAVGLIFEVSSLFANAIATVGLPLIPVLAVIVFKDSMNGVKVISMLLAIWGFVSYVYQHYLDGFKSRSVITPDTITT
ncbi:TPT domain-containing protein [Cephalotus follicularis]|uniref:Probable purine permease n=1 Tax=Cephalotus follicularis TaxID=3775 RepID=A0A1Q3BAS8_CEPFO|nr:TPT domain-containing protein [Cephalotus follicularis]